jgi:hypothetical protein
MENTRQTWRDGSFAVTHPDYRRVGSQQCIETGDPAEVAPPALIAGVDIRCWLIRPPWGGLAGGGDSRFVVMKGGLAGGGVGFFQLEKGGIAGGGVGHFEVEGGGIAGGGSQQAAGLVGGLAGGGSQQAAGLVGGLAGGGSSHEAELAGGLAGGGSQQAAGLVGGLAGGGSSTFTVTTPGPARVQHSHGAVQSTTPSINITWPTPTTTGNFLIAFASARTAAGAPTISAPAGWTALQQRATGLINQASWYIKNATSQSTTGAFTVATGGNTCQFDLYVVEYSGVTTSSPILVQLITNGSGATITSPNTGILTSGSKLLVSPITENGAIATLSAPTNGFTIVNQSQNSGNMTSGWCELITSATASTNCGATGGVVAWVSAVYAAK